MNTLIRWLRHLWLDAADSRRCLTRAGLQRMEEAVTRSEARHLGELRLCVEGGLRMSELWRGVDASQRAVQVFSQLRVWDTAHNNGVLIYLLLAENAIELVADRGLNQCVSSAEWQALVQAMRQAFQGGRFEDGLAQALDKVSAVLVANFPLDVMEPGGRVRLNELPDAPVLL